MTLQPYDPTADRHCEHCEDRYTIGPDLDGEPVECTQCPRCRVCEAYLSKEDAPLSTCDPNEQGDSAGWCHKTCLQLEIEEGGRGLEGNKLRAFCYDRITNHYLHGFHPIRDRGYNPDLFQGYELATFTALFQLAATYTTRIAVRAEVRMMR